ncbi:MAG: hydroxyacid dehydrogenase [Omnitrophica bacterium RIFCSPLOWO2_12_FULL_50_11]|nr:MAG: hydroxyacid dehydrogenase [Omnitrophica bacterium RIFCSPLOWO2_12_FULL_50_11]
MAKILVSSASFDLENNAALMSLKKSGFEILMNPYSRVLSEDEVLALVQDGVVGMIADLEPLTRRVLAASKCLKVISRLGTGLDNIDLNAIEEYQIQTYTTPEAPVQAVAELTLALILSVLRRVTEADRDLKSGRWKPLMGRLLSHRNVGVIGYGRIGKRVAELLRAFGAKVLVTDKQPVDTEGEIEYCSFEEIISNSDVLTLHVPYDSSTHRLITRQVLEKMKGGSILINTSRGKVVDEEALYEVLVSGHLAGAGLDTFATEPYSGPLMSLSQVVLTPHMGSYALETRKQMEREAAENLVKGLMAPRVKVTAAS